MQTEFFICETPETAVELSNLVAQGAIPRLYSSLPDAIHARQRYPRFGGGRHFYQVYAVDEQGQVASYSHDMTEAA
jgi:hypothetical protein